MKILLVSIGVLLGAACPSLGRASPFSFDGQATFSGSPAFEEQILHAYNFVNSLLQDPVNRDQCPIQIQFGNTGDNLGRSVFRAAHKACDLEIIELNTSLKDSWTAQIVVAHELVHLFRYHFNEGEEAWLDEGLAKLVEWLYVGHWPAAFVQRIDTLRSYDLDGDRAHYAGRSTAYATAFLLMRYLYDHLGQKEFARGLIKSPLKGWASIHGVAGQMAERKVITISQDLLTAESLWIHFALALLLNDPDLASYGLFYVNETYQPLIANDSSALLRHGAAEGHLLPWSLHYSEITGSISISSAHLSAPRESRVLAYIVEKKLSGEISFHDGDEREASNRGLSQSSGVRRYLVKVVLPAGHAK